MLYLRLGLALVFAGLVAALLWYRGEAISAEAERDKARADLRIAVDANRTLVDANKRLQEQAAINDRVLLGLADELAKINAGVDEIKGGVDNLEETDDAVREYLGRPVPDALQLQLNR